jgi:hypothetical protein
MKQGDRQIQPDLAAGWIQSQDFLKGLPYFRCIRFRQQQPSTLLQRQLSAHFYYTQKSRG